MKQSEYLRMLNLTKISLEEYVNWGEDEIYNASGETFFTEKAASKVEILSEEISSSKKEKLEQLKKIVVSCKKCPLSKNRINAVFGIGSPDAKLIFVGEGPGYYEDHIGEPFVGKAGQLLTKIIEAMRQTRETVYIANIVKCHPMIDQSDPEKRSNDRPPTFEEMEICRSYLDMQLEIINPKIIVTLGASSTKGLLNDLEPISKIRGTVRDYKNIKLISTYHPAALLRNPNLKKFVWEDMKKVMRYLDIDEI